MEIHCSVRYCKVNVSRHRKLARRDTVDNQVVFARPTSIETCL